MPSIPGMPNKCHVWSRLDSMSGKKTYTQSFVIKENREAVGQT